MSKNLVNGDSLKKYHIGVNTPNTSEELINENVTSFKVGTSNATGVDLTNQMEQSLVDITYIEGKNVKIGSKINPTIVNFDSGEKELYSVKDFFDKYENGKLHKKVKKLTTKDFTRGGALCGTNAGWQQDKGTYSFYFNHIVYDCIDEIAIECNYLNHIFYETMVNGTAPGVMLSSEWGWIAFRVDDATLGITSSDSNTQKLQKAEEWFFNSNIEIFYLTNETITDESITMLANPSEEISVISGVPTTIKHTVQLNTKSQVEETQKQIIKSNKGIWQKFKELTDVKMQMSENGYIKFPPVLGGLLIQWGCAENTPSNPEIRVNLPIAYSERIYGIQFTGQWGHSNHHYWVSSNTDYKTFITPMKIGSQDVINVSDPVYWFTIGR